MEKRQAEISGDGNAPVAKRGRWDSAPAAAAAQAPVAAAAAALAAAVAAKYAQPPPARAGGVVPGVPLVPGALPGAMLPSGAAAAVAQAAAAALQKLPLGAVAAAPGTAAASRPPSISLDALEKAKKALQLQKEIQEKLKARLPQLAAKLPGANGAAAVSAVAAPGAPGVAAVRPPLPLGAGPSMAVRPMMPPGGVAGGAAPVGLAIQAGGAASMLPPAVPVPAPEDDPFYDPALSRGSSARRGERQRRSGFEFVPEGRYQREAELFRLKSQLGPAAFRRFGPRVNGPLGDPNRIPLGGAGGPGAGVDANSVPLGKRDKVVSREGTPVAEVEPPPPAVEWWDRGLLAHASLEVDVPELPAEVLHLPEALRAVQGGKQPKETTAAAAEDGAEDGDADMVEAEVEAASPGSDGMAQQQTAEQEQVAVYGAAIAVAKQATEAAARAAAAGQLGPFQLKEARVTIYVEHPVPLEPPAEAPPPPPQPLKLTQKELKKLRTQRRLARDKEKQELIRQGLLEPPKPKVRIANLHRVLGTDAALDPTAVEKEVRKQMAERQAAHDDRNLARKLTPAERRDKKLRKLFGATAVETGAADVGARGAARGAAAAAAAAAATAAGVDVICSVYRVGRLTDPQHRFKVDANARENHMTGLMVVSDDFCVVVVEGVEKPTRRFTKLMMRRIDWSTAPAVGRPTGRDANGDADMDDDDEDEEPPPPNVCTLVWQGTVLRRAFNGFRSETVRSANAGRQMLADAGVAHYWDAAAGATEGESVPYNV